jgi:hypothetical protein
MTDEQHGVLMRPWRPQRKGSSQSRGSSLARLWVRSGSAMRHLVGTRAAKFFSVSAESHCLRAAVRAIFFALPLTRQDAGLWNSFEYEE